MLTGVCSYYFESLFHGSMTGTGASVKSLRQWHPQEVFSLLLPLLVVWFLIRSNNRNVWIPPFYNDIVIWLLCVLFNSEKTKEGSERFNDKNFNCLFFPFVLFLRKQTDLFFLFIENIFLFPLYFALSQTQHYFGFMCYFIFTTVTISNVFIFII